MNIREGKLTAFPLFMTELQIIQACKEGDRSAQQALYKHCYVMFMGICHRYQKDHTESEAALNQAYLKILTNLDSFMESNSFYAWSRKIVINTNIDIFRTKKKIRKLIDFREEVSDEALYTDILYNEDHYEFTEEELVYFIKQLPPISQKVFNLYAIDEYKHAEIAELLSISIGTSKWHMSAARKKLKTMIENELQKRKIVSYGK